MQRAITINRLGLDDFLLTIKTSQVFLDKKGNPTEIIQLNKNQTEALVREGLKALGDITGYEIPNNKRGEKQNG